MCSSKKNLFKIPDLLKSKKCSVIRNECETEACDKLMFMHKVYNIFKVFE